jgi:hypothetical protein
MTYLETLKPSSAAIRSLSPLEGVEIDQRVLAYVRRRYVQITRLVPAGYVPID